MESRVEPEGHPGAYERSAFAIVIRTVQSTAKASGDRDDRTNSQIEIEGHRRPVRDDLGETPEIVTLESQPRTDAEAYVPRIRTAERLFGGKPRGGAEHETEGPPSRPRDPLAKGLRSDGQGGGGKDE